MVTASGAAVVLRHELARLAIEQRIAPHRRAKLHRQVRSALMEHGGVGVDTARLAHHAEAADDGPALHRYANPAVREAAASGAHHESVARVEVSRRSVVDVVRLERTLEQHSSTDVQRLSVNKPPFRRRAGVAARLAPKGWVICARYG